MADLPCNLNQYITPEFGQESITFRTDSLIPQPILLTPQDNAHYCLAANRGASSHIALSWTTSTGATLYVLQWADNAQMQGGSVHQKVLAGTAYALLRNVDIRLGQTIFWRVFAMNLLGGVSVPSDVRQLTYTCPEDKDPESKESTFNIEAEIIGSRYLRSCEDTTYYIKLSFTSHDANEREICRVDGVTWTAEYVGDGTGDVDVLPIFDNEYTVVLNARPDPDALNLELKAEIRFTDLLNTEEFTKDLKVEILSEPFTFGCGLKCEEQCLDDDPEVRTFKTALDFDIFGDGLLVTQPAEETCDCPVIEVGLGCGLKFDDPCPLPEGEVRKVVSIDLEAIAGTGLSVEEGTGECPCPKLKADASSYTAGCGIDIDELVISVKYDDLATEGTYQWIEPESPSFQCPSVVLTTCSTATGDVDPINAYNRLAILQGRVKYDTQTDPYGCPFLFSEVNLPYNCSLQVSDEVLGLNFDIFSHGLKVYENEESCWSIGICANELDSPVDVKTCSEFEATDLDACGSTVKKALAYGEVYRDTTSSPYGETCEKLVTKTVIPLGCGLAVVDGRLLLDLASIPTVTPETDMFVLGYDPTSAEACKLVKFAITECPE